eukprot:TRINITY_DN2184_c0_g1_i1.p1 TRINITY_DN2184_c0_g1~~TRINITY_DN2184_c0_g1_i1.p1  ORF type:complete len:143 (-),score=50.64 TRINITY_DN2184_c0_g1_i1:141-569(-)
MCIRDRVSTQSTGILSLRRMADSSSDDEAYAAAAENTQSPEAGAFEVTRQEQAETKALEEANAAGDTVMVTFRFEDGLEAEEEFKQGQEVGHMKMKVAEAKGVEYHQVVLTLDGAQMIDPLSLCDYPAIKASNLATVDVQIV